MPREVSGLGGVKAKAEKKQKITVLREAAVA